MPGIGINVTANTSEAVTALAALGTQSVKTGEQASKAFSGFGGIASHVFEEVRKTVKESSKELGDTGKVLSSTFNQVTASAEQLIEQYSPLAAGAIAVGAGIVGLIIHLRNERAENELLKKSAEEAAKARAGIIDGIAAEATKVAELVTAIESETLTKQQRNKAIVELQKLSPEYFSNLKNERDLVDQVKIAYDGYVKSLTTKFAVQSLDKQIQALFDKRTDLSIKVDAKVSAATSSNVQAEILGISKQLRALKSDTLDLSKTDPLNLTGDEKEIIRLRQRLTELRSGGSILTIDKNKTVKDIQDIDDRINALIATRSNLGDFEIGAKKDPKTKDPLKEQISELEKQISVLEKLKHELGVLFTDTDELKLTNLKIELTDIQPLLTNDEKTRFNEKLKQDFFGAGIKITVPAQVDFSSTSRAKLEEQLSKGFDVNKAIKSVGGFEKTGDATFSKQAQDVIANITAMEDRAKSLSNTLTSTLGGAFQEVFSEIASGGKNALQILGQAIQRIIIQLISAAITAAIFAAIISIATGGTGATAAGGGFLKNFKSVFSTLGGPKLAGGGVVTGPTSGYPAVLHGTEAVIPLNQLNSVVGNTAGQKDTSLVPSIQFSGDLFRIMLNNVDRRQRRV